MPSGKTLLDYTNLFFLNDYRNNDRIIYKFFKGKYVKSEIQIKKSRWNNKISFRRNKNQ